MKISFVLNGEPVSLEADPSRRLIDVLRDDLGLTGTKEGCGEGECGACSVLLDGKLAPSCIIALGAVEGCQVLTIEGMRQTKSFEVLAQSFAQAGAVQCGYCTPGMILAAEALLRQNPQPGEDDIRRALSGNLCRCTGYDLIVKGIGLAAQNGQGEWK